MRFSGWKWLGCCSRESCIILYLPSYGTWTWTYFPLLSGLYAHLFTSGTYFPWVIFSYDGLDKRSNTESSERWLSLPSIPEPLCLFLGRTLVAASEGLIQIWRTARSWNYPNCTTRQSHVTRYFHQTYNNKTMHFDTGGKRT